LPIATPLDYGIARYHSINEIALHLHNAQELERRAPLEMKLIGINNRDLRTLDVSLNTTEQLAARVSSDRIVVSESGISSHADIVRLAAVGVHTFLVGESLMRRPDVTMATRSLLFD
jgi:indole-3-glycerol phosphate synthase